MRKTMICVIVILCILVGILLTETLNEGWIALDPNATEGEEPVFSIINSTNINVTVGIDIKGFYSDTIKGDTTSYKRLSVPDHYTTDSVGLPELPIISKLIAIPDCDSIELTLELYDSTHYTGVKVYPYPENEGMEEIFTINESFYQTDTVYPYNDGGISQTGYIRSQRVLRLTINPFQYNPAQELLVVYRRAYVELNFINSASPINSNVGLLTNICRHALLNYDEVGFGATRVSVADTGDTSRETELDIDSISTWNCDYLIICGDTFFNRTEVSDLALHRAGFNGYDVIITKVGDIIGEYPIGTGLEYKSIREFINAVYDNATARHTGEDSLLGYVLLIGDANDDSSEENFIVPDVKEDNWFHGDYYYSCVSVDTSGIYDPYYGDIMIGRLSVGDTIELQNIVNKILTYEPMDSTWNDEALLVGCQSIYVSFWTDSLWDPVGDSFIVFGFDSCILVGTDTITPWDSLCDCECLSHDGISDGVFPPINDIFQNNGLTTTYIHAVPPGLVQTEADSLISYHDSIAEDCYYHVGVDNIAKPNIISEINEGTKWVYYNGHGTPDRWRRLDPAKILHLDDIDDLSNTQYPFIMSAACSPAAFYFDSLDSICDKLDNFKGDCIAEAFTGGTQYGAVGYFGACADADKAQSIYLLNSVINGLFDNKFFISGEAILEAKLERGIGTYGYALRHSRMYNLWSSLFFRVKSLA